MKNRRPKFKGFRVSRNRTRPSALGLGTPYNAGGLISRATLAFLTSSARTAAEMLGSPERQRLLLPKVWARAKYLEREAKRHAPTTV